MNVIETIRKIKPLTILQPVNKSISQIPNTPTKLVEKRLLQQHKAEARETREINASYSEISESSIAEVIEASENDSFSSFNQQLEEEKLKIGNNKKHPEKTKPDSFHSEDSSLESAQSTDTESEFSLTLRGKLLKAEKRLENKKLAHENKIKMLDETRKKADEIAQAKTKLDEQEELIRIQQESVSRAVEILLKPTRRHKPLQFGSNILIENKDSKPSEASKENKNKIAESIVEFASKIRPDQTIEEDIEEVSDTISILTNATKGSAEPAEDKDAISEDIISEKSSIRSKEKVRNHIPEIEDNKVAYDEDFEDIDSISISTTDGGSRILL